MRRMVTAASSSELMSLVILELYRKSFFIFMIYRLTITNPESLGPGVVLD